MGGGGPPRGKVPNRCEFTQSLAKHEIAALVMHDELLPRYSLPVRTNFDKPYCRWNVSSLMWHLAR